MVKKLGISVDEWVYDEIIQDVKKRSARIQELIIKGWMYEKEQLANQSKK